MWPVASTHLYLVGLIDRISKQKQAMRTFWAWGNRRSVYPACSVHSVRRYYSNDLPQDVLVCGIGQASFMEPRWGEFFPSSQPAIGTARIENWHIYCEYRELFTGDRILCHLPLNLAAGGPKNMSMSIYYSISRFSSIIFPRVC